MVQELRCVSDLVAVGDTAGLGDVARESRNFRIQPERSYSNTPSPVVEIEPEIVQGGAPETQF